MFIRKFGKALLGKTTPFHLLAACVLGGLIGFGPGPARGPGLWLVFITLICLLPVNVWLLTLTAAFSKLFGLLLMPLSFKVGRFLLDGPTGPLFETAINTPFLALFGFEYYASTGGLVIGGLFGALIGGLIWRFIRKIRSIYIELEGGNERFAKWATKGWVKFFTWILLGSTASRKNYEKLQERVVGNPIRWAGLVPMVIVVGGSFALVHFFSGPILTRFMKGGLEDANGATVDLELAELKFDEGRLEVRGLALADRNDLDTDIFRGLELQADLGVGDLLTKRMRLDQLVIRQTSSGAARKERGQLIGKEPTAPEEEKTEASEKTIDDYLKDAKRWRERLEQVSQWLDRLGGPAKPEEAPSTEAEQKEQEETLNEQLERWVRERGYAEVAAEHLVKGAPSFAIGKLKIDGLKAMQLDGQQLNISGENLSTHPFLLDSPPRLAVHSDDGSFKLDVNFGRSVREPKDAENRIEFALGNLSGDTVGQQLAVSGKPPLRGGTVDVSANGLWLSEGKAEVDLALTIVLKNTRLTLPGMDREEPVDLLELPLRIQGPLANPRVLLKDGALKDALIAAGKRKLAEKVHGELDPHVDEAKAKIEKELGGEASKTLERAAGGLFDRFGAGKAETEKDSEKAEKP